MKSALIIAALAVFTLVVPAEPAFAQWPTALVNPKACKLERCLRYCVRNVIVKNCHRYCRRCA